MSGAVAAHAAYNGSGTQGLAVTNKIHEDDGDVMSVFWNKNDTTRQLLFGSAFVEIPAGGGSGTNNVNSSSNVIFDVNNDIDCLGDMVLKLVYTNKTGATLNDLSGNAVDNQRLITLINRVEIQVGTQIWQTFENNDLLSLVATELSSGSYADLSFQTSGGVCEQLFSNGALDGQLVDDAVATAFIPLKVFTKTLGPRLENFAEQTEGGYLMGAAPHQQVKVKVFTDTLDDGSSGSDVSTIALSLYAKNQVMCNEEREQMKAMPMGLPKRIKMTQNKHITANAASGPIEVDIDNFSLYASHLIISMPSTANRDKLYNSTAEVLMNSSSYSGKLPLGLLKLTGPTMGLFTNQYTSAGNTTKSNREIFVFPFASQAYGGSSVPLNRFDNIRLKLTLPAGAYTAAPTINVTCVGETTALYKGGAASLAMY
jgi:hypothetical protein